MRKFVNGLAELIFPARCASCGMGVDEGDFCEECAARITFVKSPLCPKCGLPYFVEGAQDHLCGDCILAGDQYYASARAVSVYDGIVLDLVHRFKYGGKMSAGKVLGTMMADKAGDFFDMSRFDLVIPVPLHRERLRHRGFNQSLVLARQVAAKYGVEVEFEALRRLRDTQPQVNLGGDERRGNLKGAFSVEVPLEGKRVLLIDDVYTTGSTVRESARALVEGGAREVEVYTAARAVQG